MDRSYELYCLADRDFYDSPMLATVEDEPLAIVARELPPGWRTSRTDDWAMFAPEGIQMPPCAGRRWRAATHA
ncbi:MAG TPA: hypothetical protein VNT54_18245 [Solirubrobacteraceae bacterium]|nr:hypothetical protein [Solirubrobacteraceae bacterium]